MTTSAGEILGFLSIITGKEFINFLLVFLSKNNNLIWVNLMTKYFYYLMLLQYIAHPCCMKVVITTKIEICAKGETTFGNFRIN